MSKSQQIGLWLVVGGLLSASGVFILRPAAQPAAPLDVPLVRLVVLPEKYHGKRVRVLGFVRLEFEGDALYPHKEDYDHALLGNGVWINTPVEWNQKKQQQVNMKYCILEGTFDAKFKGHLSMWSGSLKNITRFDVWSDPSKPRRASNSR